MRRASWTARTRASERVMSPVAALCMWNVLMIEKFNIVLKYIVQLKEGLH